MLGTRNEKEGEDFSVWLTELPVPEKHCEFGEMEERMLWKRNYSWDSRPVKSRSKWGVTVDIDWTPTKQARQRRGLGP